MKRLYFALILLAFAFSVQAQHITESLVNYKKKFNNIFTGKSSSLSFTFTRNYEMNVGDTTYEFIVEIYNKDIVLENFSVGTAYLSGSLATGRNNNFSYSNDYGVMIMDKSQFEEFVNGINKVFIFASSAKSFMKAENNMVATYKVGELIVGSEYRPEKDNFNKAVFYLKAGSESNFQMNQDEFEELFKSIKEVNKIWKDV